MSLLIAANLIDRIYMCADTRLSSVKKNGDKFEYEKLHDNQLKMTPSKNFMAVGCVGSPKLGAFIYNKIQELVGADIYIRELEQNLEGLKSDIGLWVHDYLCLTKSNPIYAKCVLVFTGQNPKKVRSVGRQKLFDLVGSYQDSSQNFFDNLFGGKSWDNLSEGELKRLTYEMLNRQTGAKDILVKGINKLKENPTATEIEIEAPDQFIFALKIDPDHPESLVTFEKFEWGDIAVYGANYDQSILPPTFFGDLDLNIRSGDVNRDIIPFVAAIYEKFSTTIGGSITNIILKDSSVYSVGHSIHRLKDPRGTAEFIHQTEFRNGKLQHFNSGEWFELIPFTENLFGNSDQALSL